MLPSTMPMPAFDLDDLGFLREEKFGLRHVSADQGSREAKDGCPRGDAVSLACYGVNLDKTSISELKLSVEVARDFQQNVEEFILSSYDNFHHPAHRYNDAAFLLVVKGADAIIPYDFDRYPLGKCGTAAFSAKQVKGLLSSEHYINEDLAHAAFQTVFAIRNRILELKLEKAHELLTTLSNDHWFLTLTQRQALQSILASLISLYQKGIFIESDIYLRISRLVKVARVEKDVSDHYYALDADRRIAAFAEEVRNIRQDIVKGNKALTIPYEPFDLSNWNQEKLIERLIHFIKNQNVARVRACIAGLPAGVLGTMGPSILQLAATYPSTDILDAVYQYDPLEYDRIFRDEASCSLIFSAASEANLGNVQYLISRKGLETRDIYFAAENEHIFSILAFRGLRGYSVMKFLIESGVRDVGIEVSGLNKNPLAKCVRLGDDVSKNMLDLLIPFASAHSKLLAIVAATTELYYTYGHGSREVYLQKNKTCSTRICCLQDLRRTVFRSLSAAECQEISRFDFCQSELRHEVGLSILAREMLGWELPTALAQNDIQCARNIQKCCFDRLLLLSSDEQQVLGATAGDIPRTPSAASSALFWQKNHRLPEMAEVNERVRSKSCGPYSRGR